METPKRLGDQSPNFTFPEAQTLTTSNKCLELGDHIFTKLPREILNIVAAFEPDIANHTIQRMISKLTDIEKLIINENEKIITKMLLPEKIQLLNERMQKSKLEIKQINDQIKQRDEELEVFYDEDSYMNLNLNAQLSSLIDAKKSTDSKISYLRKALKIFHAIEDFIKI